MAEGLSWCLVTVIVWLGLVDPFVIEPIQRRRAERRARAFEVGVGSNVTRVR